jgi:hypothetical protein
MLEKNMKKIISLFLFLILVFPIISAISIEMNSNIPKGETVIASIQGNFVEPLTKSDIYFYRGHVQTAFEYDVAKIGDTHYIYFQTSNKAENNYSINITGVRYIVGSQVSSEQISKSFKITDETADFYINPGFILDNEDFYIKIQNLQYFPITIDIETEISSGSSYGFFGFISGGSNAEESIEVSSSGVKNLYIKLENISETTIRTITLSTENTEYKIPCYVILEEHTSPILGENTTFDINDTAEGENSNITEKNCSFFGVLFGTCEVNKTNSEEIKNQTTKNETLSNKSKTNKTSNKSNTDYEVVKVGNKTVAIKDGVVMNESATSRTCAQIKGDICSSGEICNNATIYAKDAKCCVSKCVKEEEKSNKKIVGWVIIGFIFITILWFFAKKFSGTKKKSDTLLNPKK